MDLTHPKTQPTRQVLGGSENIRVGFRVLISCYFRVQVGVGFGVGSYKYCTSEPDFFFFEKTLIFVGLSPPPSAFSLFLKPHPYKLSVRKKGEHCLVFCSISPPPSTSI